MRIGVRARAEVMAERVAGRGLSCLQLTLPEAIEGLDGAPGRLNPGMASYIGEAFRQRGVQIAVLSCYINLIHPDSRERRRQIELFKEHLRYVRDFGCGIVATETGSLNPDWSFHPGNHSEKSFWRMRRGRALRRAGRGGGGRPVRGRMLEAVGSNNLQVVFDPVNLLSADNWQAADRMIEESFQLFGDRIAVLHAKDFLFEGVRSVPLGRGKLNYRLLPHINAIMEDTQPARQVLGPRRGRGRGSGRGMARSGVQVQPGMEPIRLLRLRAPASISIMRGVSSSTVRPGTVRMRCTSALGRRPSPT